MTLREKANNGFYNLNQFHRVCGSWKLEDYVVLFRHASIIVMLYIFLG